jgi:hypothetical protein
MGQIPGDFMGYMLAQSCEREAMSPNRSFAPGSLVRSWRRIPGAGVEDFRSRRANEHALRHLRALLTSKPSLYSWIKYTFRNSRFLQNQAWLVLKNSKEQNDHGLNLFLFSMLYWLSSLPNID